jgi:polyferredoxin
VCIGLEQKIFFGGKKLKNNLQQYMFWILVAFLAIGMAYPVIGLLALVCMLAPVVMAPYKGRYWCGNFCPRGSFFDHVIIKISPQKSIPEFFRSGSFRMIMMIIIMTSFGIQMHFAWNDLAAMGSVFVRIILITTIVGIILGAIFHQRTWCSFCPMGTLASWLSRKSMPLLVDDSCVNCKLCTKVCPFQLAPYQAKDSIEGFMHSDCLKCSRCIEKCPKQSLVFQASRKKSG